MCVDAVLGNVAKNNRTKFGYTDAFLTERYEGIAQSDQSHSYSGNIVNVSDYHTLSRFAIRLDSTKLYLFELLHFKVVLHR